MRVNIINRHIQIFHGHFHATYRAFAGGLHHVMSVRGCAITGNLSIYFCTTFLSPLHFFEHQNTCATGDDKAIAVFIICAAGCGRGIIIFAGHSAHRIKERRERPFQCFAATGKHDILLAPLNHFGCIANAMCRGRACG